MIGNVWNARVLNVGLRIEVRWALKIGLVTSFGQSCN